MTDIPIQPGWSNTERTRHHHDELGKRWAPLRFCSTYPNTNAQRPAEPTVACPLSIAASNAALFPSSIAVS
ncbi:MAG TPA: hypothetical protein VEP71_05285, partial [Gallionella sp.]|nr:hypothetical protein [Gallionella sp.]